MGVCNSNRQVSKLSAGPLSAPVQIDLQNWYFELMRHAGVKAGLWAWQSIELAKQMRMPLGEESVTDFLLLRLAIDCKGSLDVHTFTKEEENHNGSDWEWWFIDKTGNGLSFRVQAKIIDVSGRKALEYPMIKYKLKRTHYVSGKKRAVIPQTSRLIRRAIVDRKIPLYCLYTHWDNSFSSKTINCSVGHPDDLFGVSIIGAYKVQSSKTKDLPDLLLSMHTLSCFLRHTINLNWLQNFGILLNGGSLPKTQKYGRRFIFTPAEIVADAPYVSSIINQSIISDVPTGVPILPNGVNRVTVFVVKNDF